MLSFRLNRHLSLCYSLFFLLRCQVLAKQIQSQVLDLASQYRLEFADALSEDAYPVVQALKDSFFDRVFNRKINNRDLLSLLTQTIEAANSLFYFHRIPREIVINE